MPAGGVRWLLSVEHVVVETWRILVAGGQDFPTMSAVQLASPMSSKAAEGLARFGLAESVACLLVAMIVMAVLGIQNARRRGLRPGAPAIILWAVMGGTLLALLTFSALLSGRSLMWMLQATQGMPAETRTITGLAAAIFFFVVRSRWRAVYGLTEVIVGVGALWLGVRGGPGVSWLGATVTSFGAVYIVVRGLTNLDDGLPLGARRLFDRIAPGFFRPPEIRRNGG